MAWTRKIQQISAVTGLGIGGVVMAESVQDFAKNCLAASYQSGQKDAFSEIELRALREGEPRISFAARGSSFHAEADADHAENKALTDVQTFAIGGMAAAMGIGALGSLRRKPKAEAER